MLKRLKKLLSLAKKGEGTSTRSRPEAGVSAPSPEAAGPPSVHRGPAVVHQPIPVEELDPDAVRIVRRLTRFDHTAYLVGGCVRDLLLDRKPKDFDVGTTATPRQVKRLFRNCRIIGRRFRLAHIYFHDGKIIEVATFRARDGEGEPAEAGEGLLRRDDNVFGTPEEDALRRDFTINALFYDVNAGNVIDHAGGLQDLRRRLVRTIGDPETRFREDPIRILRAIKFAARLGFGIETETYEALRRTRRLLPQAAPARILEEIRRVSAGGAARRSFELLEQTGVLEVVLPPLAEACAKGDGASGLLYALLEELDRRVSGGEGEPTLGEIFSVLFLPVIAPRLGWDEAPEAEPGRGVNVPALVNEFLRPVAMSLKLPRAEQERCRQILSLVYRLSRPERVRPSARRALRRRPEFGAALWMLEAAARLRGGPLAKALSAWGQAAAADSIPPEEREQAEPPRRPHRRRRRRGHGPHRPATEIPPAQAPARPAGERMPPAWDDDYFFRALPKVPPILDEIAPDGSGAAVDRAATSSEPSASGRKRRRRRRPRKRRDKAPPPSPAGEPSA
jgi:poly(A) polymerase